jgi:NAD(P)-dependent dehydrogenase (short-subunit alcohol dehydrogenase family)
MSLQCCRGFFVNQILSNDTKEIFMPNALNLGRFRRHRTRADHPTHCRRLAGLCRCPGCEPNSGRNGAQLPLRRHGSDRAIKDIALDLAHEIDELALSIYAAGDLHADFLRKMSPEGWTAVLDANLTGAFLTSSHTVQLMAKTGQMMFIGAYVDHLILPKMGAYAVAKAGLETYADVLQKEQRRLNITLVKPGAVATPFWENAPFRAPADAKTAETVAAAMLAHAAAGKRGTLAM